MNRHAHGVSGLVLAVLLAVLLAALPACTVEEGGDETVNLDVTEALTAQIAATPPGGVAPLAVQFMGVANHAEGSVTYAWAFGDGDTDTGPAPVHTFNGPGTFPVLLTVTDDAGASFTALRELPVATDEVPLVALGASPALGVAPLTVAFEARAAGGNAPLSFDWDFGDGSPQAGGLPDTTHTYALDGTYIASVSVTDATGDVASDTVEITVEADLTPAVTLIAAPTTGIAPLAVEFECTVGSGNGALTARWDFGDGATATGDTVAHVYRDAGAYTARCTVTDADGDVDAAAIAITVDADLAPEVVIAASPDSGTAPLTVQFTSAALGGNPPLTYAWDFGDGSGDTVVAPAHDYTTAGTYLATLTVTDVDGDMASGAMPIAVEDDLFPAGVTVAAGPMSGIAPLVVDFFCDALSTGNDPFSLQWNFGDGATATGDTVSHIYRDAGAYTARCTVTDADGDVETDAVLITVDADLTPEVVIAASPDSGTAPLTVQFTSAALSGNPPLAYAWDFGDGSGATVAAPAHDYTTAGTYLATLTVTDADGDVAWDWREITVNP